MTPELRQHVSKVVALLASESDHEALAAARALGRMLTNGGSSFNGLADLIADAPDESTASRHKTMAATLVARIVRAMNMSANAVTGNDVAVVLRAENAGADVDPADWMRLLELESDLARRGLLMRA